MTGFIQSVAFCAADIGCRAYHRLRSSARPRAGCQALPRVRPPRLPWRRSAPPSAKERRAWVHLNESPSILMGLPPSLCFRIADRNMCDYARDRHTFENVRYYAVDNHKHGHKISDAAVWWVLLYRSLALASWLRARILGVLKAGPVGSIKACAMCETPLSSELSPLRDSHQRAHSAR